MSNEPTPAPAQPWYHDWAKIREILAWALNIVQLFAWAIAVAVRDGNTPAPPIPDPIDPVIVRCTHGWVPPTVEETDQAIDAIEAFQRMPAKFSRFVQALEGADDNKSVFLWDAEQKVLGKRFGSWDQGTVGACVSFGFGRGAQDLILGQIASGAPERWPGAEVATEPIYGGSRVEVGGGRIRGDGSVGAWAAQWVQKWGLLFRQKYSVTPDGPPVYDLSAYSETISRDWGRRGVPNDLEPIAREHPVKTVAQMGSGNELWIALGNGYPVPVCSDVGFEGPLPADGLMSPRGSWAHCMLFRGRFTHPTKGKCVVVQNSWGGYLRGIARVTTTDRGEVELPEGCFAITLNTADRMCKQRDTFALSGFQGFPKRALDWSGLANRKQKRELLEPMFAMAW